MASEYITELITLNVAPTTIFQATNNISFIVAKVKIPNNDHFKMENNFMSVKNMFPIEAFDNTAKLFSSKEISLLCDKIENENNLPKGSLGRYERPIMKLCAKKIKSE